jgi:hypothetical protein
MVKRLVAKCIRRCQNINRESFRCASGQDHQTIQVEAVLHGGDSLPQDKDASNAVYS